MDQDIIVIGGGPAGEAAGFAAAASRRARRARGARPGRGRVPVLGLHAVEDVVELGGPTRRAGADYDWAHASARRDWMISREGIDYPDDGGHVRRMEAAGRG